MPKKSNQSSTAAAESPAQGARPLPLLLGIFHRQIQGDHHLLELAQRRYTEVGLGAEFYPTDLADLQESLEFRPLAQRRYTMHLPRNIDLLDRSGLDFISRVAGRERSDAYGMIIHDQPEMAGRTRDARDYINAIRRINSRLLRITPSPYLFIEYAVGLDVADFAAVFEAAWDCERVSACIDISHVAIRTAQNAYAWQHPDQEVCDFRPDSPRLPDRIDDVVAAAAAGLPVVLSLIERLGALDKPLHFHLHDGHPLSTFSPYGISDHLSFYQEIELPFEYQGQRTVPLMFGPDGLRQVVSKALAVLPPQKLSFMLEIHPLRNQRPLGPYTDLFQNWKDLHHAEQMQAWLDLILENYELLYRLCADEELNPHL